MPDYSATVSWVSDGRFIAGTYSRAHELRFDGGAVVRGSSSPRSVPIPFSDPAGVDPEEMLVAAAAACHMLWFLYLARQAGLEVLRYADEATGAMGMDAEGRACIARIALRPAIDFAGTRPDAALLDRLHQEAHERCYIANSLRSEVTVAPAAAAI